MSEGQPPDIVMTWRDFRLHALDCENQCERAYRIVLKGGAPVFRELWWPCCADGRQLLEAWHHATEVRMDGVREQKGIARLPL